VTTRALFLLAALLSAATLSQAAPKAHADIMNTQGQKIGTATIKSMKGGVTIEAKVSNLTPGTHAIHIHTVGKCEGPSFMTAGGHFNPGMSHHGKDNATDPHPHAGDLLNFDVGANGKATIKAMDMNVTLGDGPNSLFHDGGTALVIHAGPDDYKSDPAGNSGARIACGVIEK
jgi:Cu-Zn family superoxide dismutase